MSANVVWQDRYHKSLITYLLHILPMKPGVGLCSCRLARRAWILGSLGRLFSWREAKRLEPRRVTLGVIGGLEAVEAVEEMDETESERVVLVESILGSGMVLSGVESVEVFEMMCSSRDFVLLFVWLIEGRSEG